MAEDVLGRADAGLGGDHAPGPGRPLTVLVIDASAALSIASSGAHLEDGPLIAPPLLWSHVTSLVNRAAWRGDLTRPVASAVLESFLRLPSIAARTTSTESQRRPPPPLAGPRPMTLSTSRWRLEGCRLLTVDGRLKRGAAHLVDIVGPAGG